MEISDNEIYEKLALFKKELDDIRRQWEIAAIGHTSKDAIEVQRKMNAAFIDKIKQQDRWLAFAIGEKIEPEVHFGEAVLLPASGMGT
jgi:hypothetical protein